MARAPELKPNQPGNHSIHVGANLTMKCEVTAIDMDSTHDPLITWYKHFTVNGEWADKDGRAYTHELQSTSTYSHMGDDSKLILNNITLEDEGWYSCAVKNQFGSAT